MVNYGSPKGEFVKLRFAFGGEEKTDCPRSNIEKEDDPLSRMPDSGYQDQRPSLRL